MQKEFEVQGVLTPGDPFDRVRQGHFHVVHTYQMKAGQTYTIDLNSPWDNYLRLENAQGAATRRRTTTAAASSTPASSSAPRPTAGTASSSPASAGGASGPYTLRVK